MCLESSNVTLSEETITSLDALMVEGDLLEIDLSEKESLRAVLCSCLRHNYCLHVFEQQVSRVELLYRRGALILHLFIAPKLFSYWFLRKTPLMLCLNLHT